MTAVNSPDIAKPPRSGRLAELVARAQAGDGEAFAALFAQHKKRIYSLCLLMTGDVADSEDLTQDAFIQVFRKLGTFRGDSAFSTWLYRVAVNTVLMSLRKRKPKQVSLDEPVCIDHAMVPRDLGKPDPELSGTVDRITLMRAIKDLPEGYRKIFVLHEVEGYQHHEIAAMLRCSVGNSKSQLHKAKLKIREMLSPRTGDVKAEESAAPAKAARIRAASATSKPPVTCAHRNEVIPGDAGSAVAYNLNSGRRLAELRG
jgi:RNA polymerase sigma-70 factor (ECF subfamily)